MVFKGHAHVLPFYFNATDLAAHTTQYIISPIDGIIEELGAIVQVAISTGGTIKAKLGSTDVAGSTVTSVGSDAAGTCYDAKTTRGSKSCFVAAGAAIQIVPATFTGGSAAINGWIRVVGAASPGGDHA